MTIIFFSWRIYTALHQEATRVCPHTIITIRAQMLHSETTERRQTLRWISGFTWHRTETTINTCQCYWHLSERFVTPRTVSTEHARKRTGSYKWNRSRNCQKACSVKEYLFRLLHIYFWKPIQSNKLSLQVYISRRLPAAPNSAKILQAGDLNKSWLRHYLRGDKSPFCLCVIIICLQGSQPSVFLVYSLSSFLDCLQTLSTRETCDQVVNPICYYWK